MTNWPTPMVVQMQRSVLTHLTMGSVADVNDCQ